MSLYFIILEKLSNKVSLKKNHIKIHLEIGNRRDHLKNWDHGGGRRRKGEKERGGEKERVEENLREWDSRDGGRTDMRARKEIS